MNRSLLIGGQHIAFRLKIFAGLSSLYFLRCSSSVSVMEMTLYLTELSGSLLQGIHNSISERISSEAYLTVRYRHKRLSLKTLIGSILGLSLVG